MEKNLILIIDDDKKLCALLEKFLGARNFSVISAQSGMDGMNLMEKHDVSLVILDLMLPGENGFEILKKIRKSSILPVIMLTARGETTDKVIGLELGADDYIPKPFEPMEIEARIHAVLRRIQMTSLEENRKNIHFNNFSLNLKTRILKCGNNPISLTSGEYNLLEFLLKNSNQIISRSQITEYLHGMDFDPFQRNIDILISRLRKKLNDDPKNPEIIKTIHGRGYIFVR